MRRECVWERKRERERKKERKKKREGGGEKMKIFSSVTRWLNYVSIIDHLKQ